MYLRASRRLYAIGLFIGLLFIARSAAAQSTTEGAIGGVVSDQTKAVVPGASVIVRNVATNAAGEATTDATGHFSVIHLQPGVYSKR